MSQGIKVHLLNIWKKYIPVHPVELPDFCRPEHHTNVSQKRVEKQI